MSSLSILAGQDKLDRERLTQKILELSEDDLSKLYKELNIRGGLEKIDRRERYINDPPLPQQNFCLHSFVPSKGSKPDKDGVYGWLKCRGTFNTQMEMDQRAEQIIRNVDSFHHIFHGKVGVPFPFSLDPKYVEDTVEIDIRNKARKDASEDMKRIKNEDKRVVKELKEAEQRLMEDVSEDKEEDPLDDYITKRVKRATLIFTLIETRAKMDKMIKTLRSSEDYVNNLDKEIPQLKKDCMKKYTEARERSGIKTDTESKDNMVYYIMRDLPEGIYEF